MKSFTVTAFFPDVRPAHAAFQSCEAKADSMATAAARGLTEIRKRPAIKGRRIRQVQLIIKESEEDHENAK